LKTDFDGHPIAFDLTGGEKADAPHFPILLGLGPDVDPRAAVGDKGMGRGAALALEIGEEAGAGGGEIGHRRRLRAAEGSSRRGGQAKIEAEPSHDAGGTARFGAHLQQQAAELRVAVHDVVRPLELDAGGAALAQGAHDAHAQREAERLTNLEKGGISPLALMDKGWPVYVDETAILFDRIEISAGRVGTVPRM